MTRANNNNSYTEDELKEIDNIKRFLVENLFRFTSIDTISAIATLVYKSLTSENIVMRKEYKELAATDTKTDTYRIRLGYHAKSNYKDVKDSFKKNYGYDMGDAYFGLKYFIEQIAIVYLLYAKPKSN